MTDEHPRSWTPEERLARLNALEERESQRMRKATRGAWVSLTAVAILLAVLVGGIAVASRQLQELRRETTALSQKSEELGRAVQEKQTAVDALNRQIDQKQAALSTMIGAVRNDAGALSGVSRELDKNPGAVNLVPRAYVQILDDEDRRWARNLSDHLQNAGVLPVGIEYKPNSTPIKRFQVRYYKKAEESGALRIVDIMKAAGVPAEPVYLALEQNTRVRANHFEIWCPPRARDTRLAPPR